MIGWVACQWTENVPETSERPMIVVEFSDPAGTVHEVEVVLVVVLPGCGVQNRMTTLAAASTIRPTPMTTRPGRTDSLRGKGRNTLRTNESEPHRLDKYLPGVPCDAVSGSSEPAPPGADGAPEPACPMCGETRRVSDPERGEMHCAECGLVLEPMEIVARPPPVDAGGRAAGSGRGIGPFSSPTTSRRHLGSTLTLTRDGQGRPLNWHRRYEFQHLKRVMQRQTSRVADGPFDRSQAHNEIAACGERLGLPAVVLDEAERLFREAKLRGLFRGRSLGASVGASVYAACRRYTIPRTLGEVAKCLGTRRSEVGRAFKVIQRGGAAEIPSIGTRSFLARYADELALSPSVRSSVEEMLEEAHRSPELSGLSPHGLVAALIYVAAEQRGERRSRAEIARVSAVTEVTLRSTGRLVERLFGRRSASR